MLNKYIRLVVLSAFYFCITPCFGMFITDDIDHESYTTHYNSLPAVEVADADLNSRTTFQDFLKEAEDVIVSYGLEDTVGFRLIHRHFDLNPQQVMVENYELYQSTPSLVTSAHSIDGAREKGAVPSGWIFTSLGSVVFEFTTDTAAKTGLKRVQNAPDFSTQIRKIIENYNFQDLLALALLKKETLVPENSDVYLEKNYMEDGKSIVQLSLLEDASLHIRTSWGFSGPKQNRCFCSGHWCSRGRDGTGPHEKVYGPHVDL